MLKKFFVLAFLVGALSLGFSQGCPTRFYVVEPVKLMPYLIRHHTQLHLTEEQKIQIKELIREIKAKVIPLDRKIEELSSRVRRDMIKVEDPIVVEGELRVLANLKVRRSMYNYKCIHTLKRILTEEQFKKLLMWAGYNF